MRGCRLTRPEKALYHSTGSGSTFYNGCLRRECQGERIQGFSNCIAHLSPEEEERYAEQLRSGRLPLVFSSVDVDMNFVQQWIDRICVQNADGTKVVSTGVMMQDTKMVGSLELRDIRFTQGLNLTKLTAFGVRMFGVYIERDLRLEEAVLENELSFADSFRVGDLSLINCRAKTFDLSRGAVVTGRLDARGLVVEGTNVYNAEIHGEASFIEACLCAPSRNVNISAKFRSPANFTKCKFSGDTQLGRVGDQPPSEFLAEATFNGAVFGSSEAFGSLVMTDTIFHRATSFRGAQFFGSVSFNDTRFKHAANLSSLTIKDAPFTRPWHGLNPMIPAEPPRTVVLELRRAQFGLSLELEAHVDGAAVVEDITFAGVSYSLAITTESDLQLRRLAFEAFNVLSLSSSTQVSVDQVQMQGGGELRIGGKHFSMTNFTCAKPVLASSMGGQPCGKTRLSTLKGTNCDGLTLSGFHYGEARFLGATKLDSLIISGEFTLDVTSGWRARRAVLAEEAEARSSNASPFTKEYWTRLAAQTMVSSDPAPELRHLAAVYRALRKGREDQKDEPGSADFYYGEMEMRRLSTPPIVERAILTLYWLVSGYGLRAWRALGLLALVIVGAAAIISHFPLQAQDRGQPPSFASALLFSTQSGLSLAGSADHYSSIAQVCQLLLRIIVPTLIALAALAVRARVKR
jgi:uncharacterized protein YjbI with pentapeptide repeats